MLTLVLLAGALVSGWSLWTRRIDSEPAKAAGGRSDYVLHDFELIALDGSGKESFVLRAPKLARTPGDRTMALTSPLFLLPNKQGHYWEVRSNTGWVSAEGDEIRLRGDVRTRSPKQDARPTAMNTEQLNVFPDSNRATSAVVVTITQPGSILRGRGLEADLDTKRYRLLSEVHSRYAPSSR
ncbi:MAG: LPS export ABC transporter periplasmic protein LptC [Gammaproteobacteria bacterium]|nr:LPS export ABC transporter periplasmic protein LptC [Gammaproteobacteria bacterium]